MNVKMAGGLCGGRTEATALYATGSETHHIKHIDNVSLYPYVCKWKKYPVGHPEVVICSKLQGRFVDEFEGMMLCTILPPTNLYLPLLPSKINWKLVFTLCRKCTKLQQSEECTHPLTKPILTETCIFTEVQKADTRGVELR